MVKSYMRHGPTQAFGIICSPTANSSFDGRLAYVPAWEDVLVWDVKTGEMVSMWHSPSHTASVTSILPAPSPSTSTSSTSRSFAISYNDGSIKLWNYSPSNPEAVSEIVTFNGHKKSVTTLSWDKDGTRLASGGTEGEIVIWDRVAEVGLFRLKGHRGPVTALHFIPHPSARGGSGSHPGYLVSSSKDTYLKLWDLGTQHCIQTVVVGRGEVLSCAISEDADEGEGEQEGDDEMIRGRWIVVTGSGDGEGKVWSIEKRGLDEGLKENANGELPKLIQPLTTLPLPTLTTPITQIAFHPTLPLILLQTSDRTVLALRLRSTEEVQAKQARRKKRDKEKKGKGKKGDMEVDVEGEIGEGGGGMIRWEDRITVLCTVRANAKIRSFSLSDVESSGNLKGIPLLLALNNNALETYLLPLPLSKSKSKSKSNPTIDSETSTQEPIKTHSIELPGHRQDVRCLAISFDDQILVSASSGTLKVWNRVTGACIRTMECGYVVCLSFLPGDRHVVVGTKSGELTLYDIITSTQLSTYKAHSGAIWSVGLKPDGRGLVSGSADKDVKFWEFEMKDVVSEGDKVVDRLGRETIIKTKQLTLVHTRTLKMTDDVLSVKYSPDGRLLAVALLDSTVKIFFQDTLKFFLSLYGHKLPVLSIDISHDSRLIITSSADKNIKIWGLDFGDCHRSIFAHDESVMQVAFEKGSHMFWSVGKDKSVKYWDGDKFELVQKLDGHHGEIWALATSHKGDFVITGSHDKSIRIWEKTDEPLFLEEERERELEALYDNNIASDANRPTSDPNNPDAEGEEVEAVQKTTTETLMAGEKIIEAIELADNERETIRQWEEDKSKLPAEQAEHLPRPPRDPELVARGNMEPEDYVLKVLKGVPSAQMEDALLVLPFGSVCSLLIYLDGWAKADRETILTTRTLSFILRTSSSQIIANRILRTQLLDLRNHLRDSLTRQKDMIGFNLAALKFVKGRYEDGKLAGVLDEVDEEKIREKMGKGRGKRKRVVIG